MNPLLTRGNDGKNAFEAGVLTSTWVKGRLLTCPNTRSLDNLAQDISEVIAHVAELERLTGLVGTAKGKKWPRNLSNLLQIRQLSVEN